MQKTLSRPITIDGIGLHSGCKSRLVLNPAPINHGVVFCRTDLPDKPQFPALYTHVVDTRNCTCLGDSHGNVVSTVEHLMAALAIAGVDNTLIEVNAPEIPIMDSSAPAFFRSFVAPGVLVEQNAPTAPRSKGRLSILPLIFRLRLSVIKNLQAKSPRSCLRTKLLLAALFAKNIRLTICNQLA